MHLVVCDGLEAYLPQAGLIDIRKEVERVGKQEAEVKKALESYNKKLSSPSVRIMDGGSNFCYFLNRMIRGLSNLK